MRKILIIEDSRSLREELKTLLSLENYVVYEAEDGLAGVKMAQINQPDLIISDILMPEMDGFEGLAELRKNPDTSFIPIIFLTALNSVRSHILGLGAEDYFTKPYNPVLLLARIKVLLNKAVSQKELSEPIIKIK